MGNGARGGLDNHSEDLKTLNGYTVGNVIADRANKRAQRATKQYKNRDERFRDKAKIEIFIFPTSVLLSYYTELGLCSPNADREKSLL